MAKKMELNVYHNGTVKWQHDGKLYCLHVQADETPLDPRHDWDNIAVMACWHRRYRLGDTVQDEKPEEFWRRLVRENVPESEIASAAEEGKLGGIRIAEHEDGDQSGLVDIYETYQLWTVVGRSEPGENLEYEGIPREAVAEYLMDDLTIGHCMTLMEPYAEWMPLWLYDHSGITMSCGARTGQYADRWDSGQVGWILAMKKTVMKECVEYVLDENGERIKVEHQHEGMPSTWSYLTRPLTEETWRKRAVEIMRGEVEVYDQYLTGDVYGFTLYSASADDDTEHPDWSEEDSCWGFFGSDILENGIEDQVGHGLRDAVEAGRYDEGEAEKHVHTYYTF